MKVCICCKKELEIEYFHKDGKSKDGYRGKCKNCVKIYGKKYRKENKEKIDSWFEENKEYLTEYKRKYREENKEKLNEYKKKWHENNKEYVKEQKKVWRKNKIESDPIFKLHHYLSAMIRKSFNINGFKKNSRTHEILGCEFTFFKEYIESQFEYWMNWENRGLYDGNYKTGWDIDHIIEIKTANTIEDIIKLNHYTNLRPLDSKINRVDRNYGEKNKKN